MLSKLSSFFVKAFGLWSRLFGSRALARGLVGILVGVLMPTQVWAQEEDSVFSTQALADDLRVALSQEPIVISAGPAGSMNYITAGMLCDVIVRALLSDAPRCLVEPTTGSAMNLQSLFSGASDLALVQSDREYFAHAGIGPYDGVAEAKDIRRVAAIAGLPIQAVVKVQSGVRELSELEGARIGLGEEGSSQRLVGRVVLSAAGVEERELAFISTKRPYEQAEDFCRNDLDAMILTTTAPSPLVSEMLSRCNGKLLSLEADAFSALTDENDYLVPLELPERLYPNQPEGISSFGYVVSLVSMEGRRDALLGTFASELPLVYGSMASRYDGIGLVPEDKLFDLGQTAPLHSSVQAYVDLGDAAQAVVTETDPEAGDEE